MDPPIDKPTATHGVRWVLILFVLASAVRVGWVVHRYGDPACSKALTYPDEDAYWLSARSLAAGEGLRDEFGYRATYMPAYPAFLAIFTGFDRPLWWARLVQALLAAAVAPATFLLARRWDRWTAGSELAGPVLPVLAGLAAAFDPFLIFFTGLLLTEAIFAAALTVAWLFVIALSERASGCDAQPVARVPKDWVLYAFGAGVLLLLSVLLRPAAGVLVVATVICVAIGRGGLPIRLQAAGIIVLVVLIGLMPWAARNHRVIGQWRWLTTRGGISLYDGVRPGATGGSDLAHTKTMPQVRGLSEVQWDRYFSNRAWSTIKNDPGRVAVLAWHKLARTWSLRPNVEAYRQNPIAWISAGWMVLLLASAVAGMWARRRRFGACAALLLPVLVFTLLHMVFVGSVRYRVPAMPMLMVLSAAGLCRLGRARAAASSG